jgi:hypothetical protein
MTRNPILDELYAIRERLFADAGGDLRRFLAGIRDREAASGRLLEQKEEREAEAALGLTNDCDGPATRAAEPR